LVGAEGLIEELLGHGGSFRWTCEWTPGRQADACSQER